MIFINNNFNSTMLICFLKKNGASLCSSALRLHKTMHTFCNCCHKSVHMFYWYFNGVHFNSQMLSSAIHEDMKEAILQKNNTSTSICYVNFYLQWSLYSKPVWIINNAYFCVLQCYSLVFWRYLFLHLLGDIPRLSKYLYADDKVHLF